MIVRISGTGQYELDGDQVRQLDALDTALTDAYNSGDEQQFRQCLAQVVSHVRDNGKRLPDDRVALGPFRLGHDRLWRRPLRITFAQAGGRGEETTWPLAFSLP